LELVNKDTLGKVFSDLIETSLKSQHVKISPLAEVYIVEAMSDLSSATHALSPRSNVVLPDLLRKGLEADGLVRLEYLRVTGDLALFVSGIFPDSLERRSNWFTLGEFIDMGQKAYGSLDADVFCELSDKFPEVVDVLNLVSEKIHLLSTDMDRYFKRRKAITSRLHKFS